MTAQSIPLVSDIKRHVGAYFRISMIDLESKKRARVYSRPRQIAMFLMKELTLHSLPEIGLYLGKRDHTTVMHGCGVIDNLMGRDKDLAQSVVSIREAIQNNISIHNQALTSDLTIAANFAMVGEVRRAKLNDGLSFRGPLDAIISILSEVWDEHHLFDGQRRNSTPFAFFVAPSGTWSMIEINDDEGLLVAAGTGWSATGNKALPCAADHSQELVSQGRHL